MHPATELASWWGYAEGNQTAVGFVVVVVAIAAIVYVGRRLWRR
jgi:hypothetical protein|nr:hypothetical protein [Kofleriaceae bacterium]